jgi:hypothetical protein
LSLTEKQNKGKRKKIAWINGAFFNELICGFIS